MAADNSDCHFERKYFLYTCVCNLF